MADKKPTANLETKKTPSKTESTSTRSPGKSRGTTSAPKTPNRATAKAPVKKRAAPSSRSAGSTLGKKARGKPSAQNVSANPTGREQVVPAKKTSDVARDLRGKVQELGKEATSVPAEAISKVREGTRKKANKFVKAAIQFLKGIEEKTKQKPARKTSGQSSPSPKTSAATTRKKAPSKPASSKTTARRKPSAKPGVAKD